jgi:hypothetical protein
MITRGYEAPPLVNWTCDVCGGEVVQREDDTEEAIERRLNLYEEETAPLLSWYKERSLLAEIEKSGLKVPFYVYHLKALYLAQVQKEIAALKYTSR